MCCHCPLRKVSKQTSKDNNDIFARSTPTHHFSAMKPQRDRETDRKRTKEGTREREVAKNVSRCPSATLKRTQTKLQLIAMKKPCALVRLGVKLGLCESLVGMLMLSSCSVWCEEDTDEASRQTQREITI